MTITCPVCLRTVHASNETGRVFRHVDTARNLCVMTGRIYPLEPSYEEVA